MFLERGKGLPLFSLRFSSKAKKFLQRCDDKTRARLKKALTALEQNPVPAQDFSLKKIAGEIDTYRIRLSNIRIVYTVYEKERLVRLLKVERRKDRTYKF